MKVAQNYKNFQGKQNIWPAFCVSNNEPIKIVNSVKIIHNRLLPFRRFDAINICGLLFCRKGVTITTDLIQHERIHTAQMLEMLVVGFYLWYIAEWLIRLPMRGRAYSNISFEREAYEHMHDPNYLLTRRRFAWWKYLVN